MKKYWLLVAITLSIYGCIEVNNAFTKVPPGMWRAVLEIENLPYAGAVVDVSNSSGDEKFLPFLMEIVYDDVDSFHIEIINGEERIIVEDIDYGRDRATAKDTLVINFPLFDSYIKAIYEENIMEGSWHVNYRDNYQIPFKAYHGQDHLFTTDVDSDPVNFDGSWETTFEVGTEDEYPAIGKFVQSGSELTGTFLTETGDYRFLSGQVVNDKFYLSTFDGAHAFLFEGKLLEDGSISGLFKSGKHYETSWIAQKNENATLTNAYELTRVESETKKVDFSFRSTEGKTISLSDPQYDGQPKLVQIFGTWCPNCLDEMKFLLDYFAENNDLPIQVFSIGFERYRDEEKSLEILKRYKEKMNIPFQVLHGGYFDKSEAINSFPMLNKIISYPTLLFLNGENEVVKIHTGFSGPATPHYEDFKREFNENIQEITD